MKKLMVALVAAAAAFGLRAADPGFISGSDFEGIETLDQHWSAAEGAATLTAGSHDKLEEYRPAQWSKSANTTDLVIKTTLGSPVVQKIHESESQRIGTGVYFDGLVNMTVFDVEDTPPAADLEDAKLGVYLQLAADDESVTNFVVVAKGNDGAKAYVCADADLTPGWHRLTIKAIANIYNENAAANAGFVVFVDNNAVSCTSIEGIDVENLTPNAKRFYDNRRLFASLGGANDELTSISYDGQGVIDEVAFTTVAPFDAAKDSDFVQVTWTAAKVASMTIDGQPYTGSPAFAPITYEGGAAQPITVAWVGADGFVDGSYTITTPSASTQVDLDSQIQAAVATFDNGETVTKFATIAEAVEAANAVDGGTLKLLNTAAADVLYFTKAVTLDLNGQTVEAGQDVESNISIKADKVAVTIVNTGDVVGKVEGTLKKVGSAGTFAINGGKFKLEPDASFAPEGYEFVLEDGYYVLQEEQKNYVAQIGTTKYETLAAAVNALNGGETITLLVDYALAAGEKVTFTKNATLDLNGKVLSATNAQIKEKVEGLAAFNVQAGATVTITGGTMNLGTDTVTEDQGVGGIQVYGAVVVENCTIVRGGRAAAVFDIYNASVTVNTGANLSSDQDVFRFKDENLISTVIVNGGTIKGGNSTIGGGQVMFYNYKSGHVANITINGGTFIMDDEYAFFGNLAAAAWNVTIDPSATFNTANIESTAGIVLKPGYGPVAVTGGYSINKLTYAINVTVKDNVGGKASADPASFQISDVAQTVTLTATPAEGYNFKQWNAEGITIVDDQFTIAAGTIGNIAIEAEFEADAIQPVIPNTDIDVPAGKTQAEFLETVNGAKATYLKAPYGETTKAYLDCFTAVADGADKVKFELNADGQAAIAAIVANTIATFTAEGTTLAVQNPIAGFYYSLKESTALEALDFGEQVNKQADAATFTLDWTNDAGFWQVVITDTPIVME